MLVDRHDPGRDPRLLVAVTQEITDGHDPARTVSKRFEFAEISLGGSARPGTERGPRRRRGDGTWTMSPPMIPNGPWRCASAKTPG